MTGRTHDHRWWPPRFSNITVRITAVQSSMPHSHFWEWASGSISWCIIFLNPVPHWNFLKVPSSTRPSSSHPHGFRHSLSLYLKSVLLYHLPYPVSLNEGSLVLRFIKNPCPNPTARLRVVMNSLGTSFIHQMHAVPTLSSSSSIVIVIAVCKAPESH